MKIIEPKVELWRQEDAKAHVARCVRVCYGKETGNDEATVKRLINSKQIADATVCKECIDKLDNETCFVACDVNKEGYVISTYDTLWIKNNGLKEFFKELDLIQPINIMPKEHFYTVFGNVIKDFYSNKENENN